MEGGGSYSSLQCFRSSLLRLRGTIETLCSSYVPLSQGDLDYLALAAISKYSIAAAFVRYSLQLGTQSHNSPDAYKKVGPISEACLYPHWESIC